MSVIDIRMCFCGGSQAEHANGPPPGISDCAAFRPRQGPGATCFGGSRATPCSETPVATINGESVWGWRACRCHADVVVMEHPHLSVVWDKTT